MNIISKYQNQPPISKLKKIQWISCIFGILIYVIMAILMFLSGTPTEKMMEGQISFNSDILVDIYWQTNNLGYYRIAQILDYGFMLGYGLFIFSTSLIISRKYKKNSTMNKIGIIIALLGLTAAIFDAMENIFILMTLMNPFGFPSIFAIFQSSFAVPKWILIAISLIYAISSFFIKGKREEEEKKHGNEKFMN